MSSSKKPSFVFFGTDDFSILVLEELRRQGILPELIVTTVDRPKGRGLRVLPPPVKVWAMANEIPFLQPSEQNDAFKNKLRERTWDVFLVASYGRIIPADILDIPQHGSLNIHPSLLPKLRGASPIHHAILYEDGTGVTVMKMDAKMDHGPIIAQQEVSIENWPPKKAVLEAILARAGATLFSEILPNWIDGTIEPTPQDHDKATFTKKITKDQAFLDLSDDPMWNYRKFQAFHEWPRPYFFAEKNEKKLRVIVTEASFENDEFTIEKVLPEGKKEMNFQDFLRGGYTIPTT